MVSRLIFHILLNNVNRASLDLCTPTCGWREKNKEEENIHLSHPPIHIKTNHEEHSNKKQKQEQQHNHSIYSLQTNQISRYSSSETRSSTYHPSPRDFFIILLLLFFYIMASNNQQVDSIRDHIVPSARKQRQAEMVSYDGPYDPYDIFNNNNNNPAPIDDAMEHDGCVDRFFKMKILHTLVFLDIAVINFLSFVLILKQCEDSPVHYHYCDRVLYHEH